MNALFIPGNLNTFFQMKCGLPDFALYIKITAMTALCALKNVFDVCWNIIITKDNSNNKR